MATRRPFWKWHCWKSISFCLWPPSTYIWNLKLKFQSILDLCSGNHAAYRVQKPKNPIWLPGSHLKLTLLKINRLLPIYISIVPLKFGVDIQSQSKVRVWKPKNPIWLPGGQSKLDLCSGNHVVYRQPDGRTDGQGESSIPPSNFIGRGYNKLSWP